MGARHVFWEPSSEAGLEHLRLELHHDRLVADGLILRQVRQDAPVRLWYRLRCDGSALVVDFRYSILRDKWERDDNKQRLTTALQAVLGHAFSIRSQVVDNEASSTEN